MNRRVIPIRRIEGTASEMSDESLVAACGTGDAAALGALFDRYHDTALRFLARLSGTDDRDLDDLVQLTFEAMSRAAARFDGRSSVRTWVLGIANNVARHHVRAEIRRKRVTDVASTIAVTAGDAAADTMERERSRRLGEAIASLPSSLKETFVLVYLEGVSGPDVARLLGVREGTVWKRLHQARAQLRQLLGEVYP